MKRPLVVVDPWPRRRDMIFTEAQWARLEGMADVVACDGEAPMPSRDVEALLPDAIAILGQTDLPAERIARAPRLQAVINVEGNFFANIDYAACFSRGIDVLCVAPIFALPVAEMALGLALDLARGISTGNRAMRAGQEAYGLAGNRDAFLLSRATVGIVGFGQLGRALRQLLTGFGCTILVHDPWLPAASIEEDGCTPCALDDLLERAHVIFLCAGVTAENRGFIGQRELGLISSGAAVLLMSRADIVDFSALLAEARSGRLRVATDVFPVEPVPCDDPVRGIDGLLLSSHRAGGIPEAFHDLGERVLDDLALIMRGLPPVRLQAARRQSVGLLRSKPGRTYGADAGALTPPILPSGAL